MNLLFVIGIIAALVFLGSAANDAYLGKKIESIETRLDGEDRELEMLLKVISDLGMDAARQKERADMLEDKVKELAKKTDAMSDKVKEIDERNLDAENVAKEIIQRAEESAKQVEQQWNSGLQGMLGWSPYGGNDMAGGT